MQLCHAGQMTQKCCKMLGIEAFPGRCISNAVPSQSVHMSAKNLHELPGASVNKWLCCWLAGKSSLIADCSQDGFAAGRLGTALDC